MKPAALLLCLLTLPGAAPSRAPDWVLRDRDYRRFLGDLQNAVRRGDREAVIRLADLPLRVNGPGRHRAEERSAAAIRRHYGRIFIPAVRRAILAQRFETLFGSSKGLMIGDGAVWFDHTCPSRRCTPAGPVRMFAVNLPDRGPAPERSRSRSVPR